MTQYFIEDSADSVCHLHLVDGDVLESWLDEASPSDAAWVRRNLDDPVAGTVLPLPDGADGEVRYLGVTGGAEPFWSIAGVARLLPAGHYRLASAPEDPTATGLAWALGQYQYDRYLPAAARSPRRLQWPDGTDRGKVLAHVAADTLTRDLINTPAEDMGPDALEAAARAVAAEHAADIAVTTGDDLLTAGFPAIHAVGRASSCPPRLLDLRWGDPGHRRLTLVGKGVCFDSGGLNLKPAAGMRLMKKDMGGAAHVLGLASLVMAARLPVRLRVLVPAVENSVSGNAYRPGDVVQTRAGLTVEIGNTDAEGRMVLCDALSLACEEEPDLVIDMATLTGAARVALGPDLPALFAQPGQLARAVERFGEAEQDPLWPMPLWAPYAGDLKSPVADLNNIAGNAFAGAIYGGLFLGRFVPDEIEWMHVDVFSWNPRARTGRPEGGAAQGLRAFAAFLRDRFPG
jgi:leucyl aminopeptidase